MIYSLSYLPIIVKNVIVFLSLFLFFVIFE